MARSKRKSGLSLPWEERGALLRSVLAGPRWKIALLAIGALWGAWIVWNVADTEQRMRRTRAAIGQVHRAIDQFRADVGRCPSSSRELVRPPTRRARYLREMPKDGWDQALFMECPSTHDPQAAEVVSAGPSGNFFTDDNVR